MRVFYVIPPNGVNQYRSQADAQAAFESGEVWRCTGHAEVDEETGTLVEVYRYGKSIPARYTQGCEVKIDEDHIIHVPLTWALQWKPGRVSFLRFKHYGAQRKVSYQYGPGEGKALIKERETSSREKKQDQEIVHKQRRALRHELEHCGGWATSGGIRFRPFLLGDGMEYVSFPMVVWHPSGINGPVSFDANPACRMLGDRELERWYENLARVLYWRHAKAPTQLPANPEAGATYLRNLGNTRTAPVGNPDHASIGGSGYQWDSRGHTPRKQEQS